MSIIRKLILTAAYLSLVGCSVFKQENPYWYVAVAAPQHYEMWVLNMHLEKSGERSWRVPVGFVGCCWQGPYGPSGGGGAMEPFPNLVALHWFSFSEQKYYAILIRVPPDLQERMREPAKRLNQNGTVSYEPRSTLVLGLAPGGEVVVWMMNQTTNAVEVMRLSGVEVEGDVDAFKEGTAEYLKEHGAYLKEHGIPLDGW